MASLLKKPDDEEDPALDGEEGDDDEDEDGDDDEEDDEEESTPAGVAQDVTQAIRDALEDQVSVTAEKNKILLDLCDESRWVLIVKRRD